MDVSVVHPHLLPGGWHFVTPENAKKEPALQSEHSSETFPDATADDLYGFGHLADLYRKASPEYSARFTVPVLWDKKNETIVSNESSEIIRDFTQAFDSLLEGPEKDLDTYPEELRAEIDELNTWVYDGINNGVYKCGFASTQAAYDKAGKDHIAAMDRIEELLSDGREFLVGGRLTEADVRLYTTIGESGRAPGERCHERVDVNADSPQFATTPSTRSTSRPTGVLSATTTPTCTAGLATSTGTTPPSRRRPTLTVSTTYGEEGGHVT